MGLYRDDGLAVLKNHSGRQAERVKKQLHSTFQSLGLRLTAQVNVTEANFLDVTMDLRTDAYKPYRKPNDMPVFINTQSNHPPAIIKQIPISVSKRISKLSSTVESFTNTAPMYNNALKSSGYTESLAFAGERTDQSPKRQRHRNIIWFNPPFS